MTQPTTVTASAPSPQEDILVQLALALEALPVELVLLCPISAALMVRRMSAERRARVASSEEDAWPAATRAAK